MKRTLLALALAASFAASAQTTVDSTSGSQSAAGAQSGSVSGINAQNSGNVSATGNENASRSQSASNSGASSGSQSGALGNVLEMNNYAPEVQTIIQDLKATNDQNVHYSGTVENKSSGTTTQNTNVHYSGTQTVKNVPSIAMSGPASGPCTGASGGVGLAGPGWGLGLNGSTVMADCRLRENTRVLGMAMQSLDGAANPQEKGEVTVLFMEAVRALGQYNAKIASEELGKK